VAFRLVCAGATYADDSCRYEGLLEIGKNVVDVLDTHRNPDKIVRHSRCELFIVRKLFMRRGPWVYRERLGITNTACQLAILLTIESDRSNSLGKM